VNAAAKTIHGAHDSSEKTEWIAKEIIKRKQKREMKEMSKSGDGSGVPGAPNGQGPNQPHRPINPADAEGKQSPQSLVKMEVVSPQVYNLDYHLASLEATDNDTKSAKGGVGEFWIENNMDEPNEFLGVDMDGNKQTADGARPEKPIVEFGFETLEGEKAPDTGPRDVPDKANNGAVADRDDPEIDVDLSIDEIKALLAMLREADEADQASQQQYTPEGVAATLEAPLNGCFMRHEDPEITQGAIRIPDITPFIPRGTDPDVAKTLMEMYRLHCISLVECVRDMRLKQFHQLFFSFYGTLTLPVQKLLAAPSLGLWVQEADWVMYKVWLLDPVS
jgi:hypothetical protein